MEFVNGDIVQAKNGIIVHQCNCQLVMGAGLAKQIRMKYPKVFTEYKHLMGKIPKEKRLGKSQIVEVISRTLYVANLFGQFNYMPKGIRHTDYDALSIALNGLKIWHSQFCPKDFPVFFPKGMGSGLAGGNWEYVSRLIETAFPNAIIVCKK